MKKIATALLLICTAAFAQQQGTFTDSRDGKKYKTTKIGSQVWMAENLNYNASGSKCYDNKAANCDKYGRLYNWNTAKNVCPNGWHLPTNEEWDILYRFADGSSGTSSKYDSKTAGKFLKAKSGWNSNGNGQDKFGFAALPGGIGFSDGDFDGVGSYGIWWSASEYNASGANGRDMSYDTDGAEWNVKSKTALYSVRCLQGSEPEYANKNNQTQTNSSTAFAQQQGSFTDSRDGKKYKTTKIGSQVWMAENLNYNASDSKCYDNNNANCTKYGRLYDWNVAIKACPAGWHLSTREDWNNLESYIESDKNCKRCYSKYLTAKSGWKDYHGDQFNGTDDYGFAALPGGQEEKRKFGEILEYGYWWIGDRITSSMNEYEAASYRYMGYNDAAGGYDEKTNLRSVRCVQGGGAEPSYAKEPSQAPTNPINNAPANTGKSQESPSKLETTVKILEALSGAAKDFSESYNSIYGIGNQPNTQQRNNAPSGNAKSSYNNPAAPTTSSTETRSRQMCPLKCNKGECTFHHILNYCNGTGKIDHTDCKGKGCPKCKGTGKVECPLCHGDGKCRRCKGTGYI